LNLKAEPPCPKCHSAYTYSDRDLWVCPECAHEWSHLIAEAKVLDEPEFQVRDAHGNLLVDGDSVTIVKDLKVKGSSTSLKVGTKVRNIQLVESDDGHNISCKIEGFGEMNLKSEFVKKA
jgi:protein PhnA